MKETPMAEDDRTQAAGLDGPEDGAPAQDPTRPRNPALARLTLLLDAFQISLGDLARSSGNRISKSTLHRFVTQRRQDLSPRERQAIAIGLLACLRDRCDSAYLFGDR